MSKKDKYIERTHYKSRSYRIVESTKAPGYFPIPRDFFNPPERFISGFTRIEDARQKLEDMQKLEDRLDEALGRRIERDQVQ